MCCTVGDDGMDWGQAGEKRKQLPLCAIFGLPEDGWCGRASHCAVDTHICSNEYRHIFACTPAQKQAAEQKTGECIKTSHACV